jgi:hypothetical protein
MAVLRPLIATAVLIVAGPRHGVDAQTPSSSAVVRARVVGTVYDSIGRRPLGGAFVAILGTALSAVADSAGDFRFDSVPPGTLTFTADHATLDSIGVSGLTRTVTAAQDSQLTVILATPSFRTLWIRACGDTIVPVRADTGFIYGTVREAAGRRPMANAELVLSWFDVTWKAGDSVRTRGWQSNATSDSSGSYVLCGVPDNLPMQLRGSTTTSASGTLDLSPAGRRMMRRDIMLGALAVTSAQRGTISGVATDTLGIPKADARVVLDDSVEVRTDSRGHFTFRNVAAGSRQLVFIVLGFAPFAVPVEVVAGDTARVSARLQRVTVLAPTNINADSARMTLTGFDERMREKSHGGYFITAKEIEKRGYVRTTSLFDGVPGVKVLRVGDGTRYSIFGHGGKVMMRRGSGSDCEAVVYLDGIRIMPGIPAGKGTMMLPGVDVDAIVNSSSIAGIEVYPSANRAPPQYQILNGTCAVVLIWTKTSG